MNWWLWDDDNILKSVLNVIGLLSSHLNDTEMGVNFMSIKSVISKVFACF